MAWLCLWQGWLVSGSIFQFNFLLELTKGTPILIHETIFLLTAIFLIIERYLCDDYELQRSYFSGPMLLMTFALVLSWTRGMIIRQQFVVIYEAHESLLIPISFFVFVNIFRDPKERKVMLTMFFLAAIMKAADSTWIKFFSDDVQKSWGTLLFWRDGFILAIGIAGTLTLANYRGKVYEKLRTTMYIALPLMMYGLIVSFRRTFILGLFASVIAMFFTVGRGRVKRHAYLFLGFLLVIVITVLATDPVGMMARLVGALISPTEEGSSYIRLMEYPNVLANIYHNPIFGVALGTQWFQYYKMPMFANYTTLGCHNSYLYWPLRTGIIGSVAFLWFLCRIWKSILINWRTQKSEEDFLMNQILIHSMVIYNFGCFFGLMYADAMNIMTGFIMVMVQLQMKHQTGLTTYRRVKFLQTLITKQLVFRAPNQLTKPVERSTALPSV